MAKRDESKVRRTQPEERVVVRDWTGVYLRTTKSGSADWVKNPKEARTFHNENSARVFLNVMGYEGEPVPLLSLVA